MPALTRYHAVVHVSNWERSNTFYHEVLGAEVIDLGGRYAYRFGQHQLKLHGPGLKATPLARLPVQPGGSDLCFPWDGTSVYFRDPDSSLLEFISYQTNTE